MVIRNKGTEPAVKPQAKYLDLRRRCPLGAFAGTSLPLHALRSLLCNPAEVFDFLQGRYAKDHRIQVFKIP